MTSIEWLMKKITNEIMDEKYIEKLSIEKTNLCRNYVKQAKEMHKQEIMNTYIIADSESTIEDSEHNALKFYERTYGSKGSDETKTDKI